MIHLLSVKVKLNTKMSTPLAAVCIKEGSPTAPLGPVLTVKPWPVPEPKPGFIKVAVQACSLNYADPLTVKGEYQVKMKTPFVPGCEASGIVIAVGSGVTRFKPGDKVTAFNQGGMFAQQCVVHEACAWRVPDGVDLDVVSAVPVTYGTADLALRHRSGLKKGQCVLVLGAGGGVGVAAIQIAKHLGAHVIAVTQGADKVSFVKSQGADVVIDLNDTNDKVPLNQLIKTNAPKGVHVVIDPVGGSLFNEALKSVAWGAHIVVIGFAAGGIPKVKNTTVHGLFWGSYLQHQPQVLRASMDDIMSWLKDGSVKPHVSHRFPLDKLPEAFQTMLDRKVLGKILLIPGQGVAKL